LSEWLLAFSRLPGEHAKLHVTAHLRVGEFCHGGSQLDAKKLRVVLAICEWDTGIASETG
jgi:hypothetical protein